MTWPMWTLWYESQGTPSPHSREEERPWEQGWNSQTKAYIRDNFLACQLQIIQFFLARHFSSLNIRDWILPKSTCTSSWMTWPWLLLGVVFISKYFNKWVFSFLIRTYQSYMINTWITLKPGDGLSTFHSNKMHWKYYMTKVRKPSLFTISKFSTCLF